MRVSHHFCSCFSAFCKRGYGYPYLEFFPAGMFRRLPERCTLSFLSTRRMPFPLLPLSFVPGSYRPVGVIVGGPANREPEPAGEGHWWRGGGRGTGSGVGRGGFGGCGRVAGRQEGAAVVGDAGPAAARVGGAGESSRGSCCPRPQQLLLYGMVW